MHHWRRTDRFASLATLVAALFTAACGGGGSGGAPDLAQSGEDRAQLMSQSILHTFASAGVKPSALTPDQQAFVDQLTPVLHTLTTAEQTYVLRFVIDKLTPQGLTLQQFLNADLTRIDTSFRNDAEYAAIGKALRARLGIATTQSLPLAGDSVGVARPALTAVIDCITVGWIVLVVGAVIVLAIKISGDNANTFCANCNMSASMGCSMAKKEVIAVQCTAGGMTTGSGSFDAKRDVMQANGQTQAGWSCTWQCT